MPKIVRINLETKEIKTEDIEKGHPLEYFGGRSLSAKILMDELDPKTEPLSKENKLILRGSICWFKERKFKVPGKDGFFIIKDQESKINCV